MTNQPALPVRGDGRPAAHGLLMNISHYSDVIMSAMASQITGVSMVCSTVCSGAAQRKHQSSASLAFVRGIPTASVTGEFPSQRTSNVENASI